MLKVNKRKINCPIFSAREKIIQGLNHAIWREDLTSGELINKAHSLWVEADILSNCAKHNPTNPGCKICKAIANLRKSRARDIIGQPMNLPSWSREKILYSSPRR